MTEQNDCCGADAHVHTTGLPLFMRPGLPLVVLDHTPLVLCFSPVIAERVAALINEHGLLGVPAGMPVPPQTVWPPPMWPAPTGLPSSPPGVVDSQ